MPVTASLPVAGQAAMLRAGFNLASSLRPCSAGLRLVGASESYTDEVTVTVTVTPVTWDVGHCLRPTVTVTEH